MLGFAPAPLRHPRNGPQVGDSLSSRLRAHHPPLIPFLAAMAIRGPRKPTSAFQLLLFAGCAACGGPSNRPDLAGPISLGPSSPPTGAQMSICSTTLLPNIVRPERHGLAVGFGVGLGYCGGLISLFSCSPPHSRTAPIPSHVLERLVGPASSLWLALFVLPMFLFTPTMPACGACRCWNAAKQGGASLVSHGAQSCAISGIAHLPFDRLHALQRWLASIIAFGGVYASANSSMEHHELASSASS